MTIFAKIFTVGNLLLLVKGAGISLAIAAVALLIGVLLGTLGALCKLSESRLLRLIANIYIEIIRGTPMLLQILFLFLVLPWAVKQVTGTGFIPNPYIIGTGAIGINSGAYSAELIRSGIQSVDKGQTEAGKALGFTGRQIMRFIVLPQSFKRIVPPLVSEFIVLIKDSSLITTIGGIELLQRAQILGTKYYNYLIPLMMASALYLVMTLTVSFIAKKIERRLAESD